MPDDEVTYFYSTVGTKTVRLVVSDGVDEHSVLISFRVLQRDGCYKFRVQMFEQLHATAGYSSSLSAVVHTPSVLLTIEIVDEREQRYIKQHIKRDLTAEFYRLGEQPHVRFQTNVSEVFGEPQYDESRNRWTLELSTAIFDEAIAGNMLSTGIAVFGCSVDDTSTDIFQETFPSMSTANAEGRNESEGSNGKLSTIVDTFGSVQSLGVRCRHAPRCL